MSCKYSVYPYPSRVDYIYTLNARVLQATLPFVARFSNLLLQQPAHSVLNICVRYCCPAHSFIQLARTLHSRIFVYRPRYSQICLRLSSRSPNSRGKNWPYSPHLICLLPITQNNICVFLAHIQFSQYIHLYIHEMNLQIIQYLICIFFTGGFSSL